MTRPCRLALLLLTGLLVSGLPASARAATNSALGGLGGVANGTVVNGDGTGSARIEVNGVRLALTKQARDLSGAVLPSGSSVTAGQEIYFVLWVDNPTPYPASDVRIEDVLDETQFEYVAGTLQNAALPSGASDAAIWAGTWGSVTDAVGGPDDEASFVGIPPAGVRRFTMGAVVGQVNQVVTVPPGSVLAVRFRVVVSAVTGNPALTNIASGTLGGLPLDVTAAGIDLQRVGGAVSSAVAEINPATLLAGTSGNRLTYHVLPTIAAADSGVSRIEITVPGTFTSVSVSGVSVAGAPLAENCSLPGPGEYCAQLSASVATIRLGTPVTTTQTEIRIDLVADAPSTTGVVSFPSRIGYLGLVTPTVPGDADGNPSNSNGLDVEVVDTQGLVLRIDHHTEKSHVLVGEVVPFVVPIRNLTTAAVDSVRIDARIPAGFDYLPGSARIDGSPTGDPAEQGRDLVFPVGDIPGLVDSNGNGQADPGEAGFRALTYQVIVGSGTEPGAYVSSAVAKDYCQTCMISNESEAGIALALDPDFELATILGKVFHDRNGDGWQDPDEEGVAGARVALDDGTYAITDEHGRYHFPVITPGQRVLKIDHGNSHRVTESTTDESLVIRVSTGLVAKANFGVRIVSVDEVIGDDGTQALAIVREAGDNAISVVGNVHGPSLIVNGTQVPLPEVSVEMRQARRADVLEIQEDGLPELVSFMIAVNARVAVNGWVLTLWNSRGDVLRTFDGRGSPPAAIRWEGDDGTSLPEPGQAGTYQLEVHFVDTTRVTSPRRLFVVDSADRAGAEDPEQFRAKPYASINGAPATIGSLGRFADHIDDLAVRSLVISMSDSLGQSVETTIPIPHLEILDATEIRVLPRESIDQRWLTTAATTSGLSPAQQPIALMTGIAARTEPRNVVELNGTEIPLGPGGSIDTDVPLTGLRNTFRILIRNPEGYSRIVNLFVDVTSQDGQGKEWRHDPTPPLRVELPPEGVPLRDTNLVIRGSTAPGNRVGINGQETEVDSTGSFSTNVELPPGSSRLVVEVTDPQGNRGAVERNVDVARTDILLLAFADGKFGRMEAEGNFEAAGIDDADRYYAQGRIAYYLKGRIAGKYLITSALDTGFGELDELFDDLGPDETGRLFRNLDPDRLYPVYGDGSSVVFDTESQGKFYLALESDALDVLVGNYVLDLAGPELATYQRTLFGGRASYRSVSETRYGDPNTQVLVFGADVRLVHVRNEMRATGGSIYYLRHDHVVEGSEQITLVVRDKNTGLLLRRDRQRRNVDYTVKYPEGRVNFRRPITSVVLDGMVVNEAILPGNPVWIEVDYEARLDLFENNGGGARARQQIGDHVAVGATYVDDEQAGVSYELQGVDSEIRLRDGTRLSAEYAESEGIDAQTYVSQDGGLTFEEGSLDSTTRGTAWRVGAEVDVGEWFSRPDRLRVIGYYKDIEPGFASNGNFLERGTEKAGAHAHLKVGQRNTFALRHARERTEGTVVSPGGVARTNVTSAQWDHQRDRLGLSVEYFGRDGEDDLGNPLEDRHYAAGRLTAQVTDRLEARAGYQQTLSGVANDQASAGLQYKLLDFLSLDGQGVSGDQGNSAQAGAVLEAGRTRVYVSEQRTDDGAGTGATTVLGAQTPLGSSSKVYSEYQWDRQGAGDRTISSLGVQKNWDPSPGLRLVTGGELSDVDSDTEDASRASVAASISYERPQRISVWSHNEIRYQEGIANLDQYLTSNRLELTLWPSFPLLGFYRYSRTEDRETGALEASYREASVGMAYRPIRNDRLNGMARYTRLSDQRPDAGLGASSLARRMDVLSAEGVYGMHRRVEWSGKAAGRILDERFAETGWTKTHTMLGVLRVDLMVRQPIDFGIEYRALRQRETDDTKHGWVLELSRKFGRHLRLGAGYSFTDVSDDELSSNDYSVRGWYLRFQGKN